MSFTSKLVRDIRGDAFGVVIFGNCSVGRALGLAFAFWASVFSYALRRSLRERDVPLKPLRPDAARYLELSVETF